MYIKTVKGKEFLSINILLVSLFSKNQKNLTKFS